MLKDLFDVDQDNEWNINNKLKPQIESPIGIIPFIGAGLSMPLGYPGWTDFLVEQAERAHCKSTVEEFIRDGFFEEAAEEILKRRGPTRFNNIIEKYFGDHSLKDKRISGAVSHIPYIAKGLVITTNFDRVLEHVFEQEERIFKNVINGASSDIIGRGLAHGERMLLKIHGDYADSSYRVLTFSEYQKYYGSTKKKNYSPKKDLPQRLRQILFSRSLLFIGCSLNKDRTTDILRGLAGRRKGIDDFAIVERPSSEADFKQKDALFASLDLIPVWYPEGQHGLIEELLSYLSKKSHRKVEGDIVFPQKKTGMNSYRGEKLTAHSQVNKPPETYQDRPVLKQEQSGVIQPGDVLEKKVVFVEVDKKTADPVDKKERKNRTASKTINSKKTVSNVDWYLSEFKPVPPENPRFTMASSLVSNALFFDFLKDNQTFHPASYRKMNRYYLRHWKNRKPEREVEQFPVVYILTEAVIAFAQWIGQFTGTAYRLPTVEEWKEAAMTDQGDGWLDYELDMGRVDYHGTGARPHSTESMAPNDWGIRDLTGHAWDLCCSMDGNGIITNTYIAGGSCGSTRDALESVEKKDIVCRPDTGFRLVHPV